MESSNIVFLVEHVHQIQDEEDVKTIGIYSTRYLAEQAIEALKLQPGFSEAPDGFNIDEYALDEGHWTEGYVTVRGTCPPVEPRTE